VKRKLVCFCEHAFESEVPDNVDLAAQPEIRQALLSGDFPAIQCPGCGKTLKPEFPVLVRAQGRTLFFVPELDRVAYYRGKLPYPVGEVDRVAIGYDELAEKLRIEDAGLDDRLVEVLKYYLLQKVLESYEGEGDVRLLFSALEPEALVFPALGLRAKEVGVLRVSRQMADKAAGQLQEKLREEPFDQFLAGPYVSVNKLATETPE